MPEKEVKYKKLETGGLNKKVMYEYFMEIKEAVAKKDRKIAWCTSVGPAEILRGLGYLVYFPENEGAMLGATRMATDLIPSANAIGYSPDICSYTTSHIGSYLEKKTPLQRAYEMELPKPDVLVYNTNQCRDVQDWFSWFAREWDVPIMGIQTYRGVPDVTGVHLDGMAEQFKVIAEDLAKIADTSVDMNEIKRVTGLSHDCSELWKETLFKTEAVPSPITFFDGTIVMGPAVVCRGMESANEYYKEVIKELDKRVEDGVAAVDDEKYRLYWDGMPVWGKLRDLSTLFASLQVNVVASTYCNSWIFTQLDPADPFRSMAKAYTELFIVRDDEWKQNYMMELMEKFKIDGMLYHDSKTCPNNTNCRYGMPQRIQEKTGKPFLIINGDLNDLRFYSDEQTKTNIEAFVEQLGG
jgi:benzoyl-CoA reductase/2-hydroxyglutaryl-CoA dehydratase subunit BcrC/BadD/HgdB